MAAKIWTSQAKGLYFNEKTQGTTTGLGDKVQYD